jgi:uncharacterized protein YjiS (DUF1127 family)
MTHAEFSRSAACAAPRRRPGLFKTLTLLLAARRQRQALGRMDDSRLADIGLSRSEALEESRRSFWDAPESWKG